MQESRAEEAETWSQAAAWRYSVGNPRPKASCTEMVTSWALKGLLCHDFVAYVYTIVVLGAFGTAPVKEELGNMVTTWVRAHRSPCCFFRQKCHET